MPPIAWLIFYDLEGSACRNGGNGPNGTAILRRREPPDMLALFRSRTSAGAIEIGLNVVLPTPPILSTALNIGEDSFCLLEKIRINDKARGQDIFL